MISSYIQAETTKPDDGKWMLTSLSGMFPVDYDWGCLSVF